MSTPSMRLLVTTDSDLADFAVVVTTDPKRATLDATQTTDARLADARVIVVTDEADAVEFVRWVT